MRFVDETVTILNKKEPSIKYQTGGIFVAKSTTIASGIELVSEILKKQNSKNTLYINKKDGDLIKRGDVLLSIRGSYNDILKMKDTCQNLFSYSLGITSSILKYQNEIKDLKCKILFKENLIPGIGEYFNKAVLTTKSEILNHNTLYFDQDIWESDQNIHEILDSYNDDQIYVEVNNLAEFKELTISKCTHIVCVDFTPEALEMAIEEKNNKIVIAKNNMTFAGIRSFASKKIDYVIINNFTSNIKLFDIEFKYFKK